MAAMSEPEYRVEAWFGALQVHEWFRTGMPDLKRGDRVILRTARGVEVGQIVQASTPRQPDDSPLEGEVLRHFEPADFERVRELEARASSTDFDTCERLIAEHGLAMRLVHVEHLIGGTKVVFYFVADGRVDFRELVKDLASAAVSARRMRGPRPTDVTNGRLRIASSSSRA